MTDVGEEICWWHPLSFCICQHSKNAIKIKILSRTFNFCRQHHCHFTSFWKRTCVRPKPDITPMPFTIIKFWDGRHAGLTYSFKLKGFCTVRTARSNIQFFLSWYILNLLVESCSGQHYQYGKWNLRMYIYSRNWLNLTVSVSLIPRILLRKIFKWW